MPKTLKQFLLERSGEEPQGNAADIHVFHGAGKHFNQFSQDQARAQNDHMGGGIGYFTTSHDIGKSYAKHAAKRSGGSPHVYHVHLKMKNVFDVDHHFTGEKLKHILPPEKHHEDFARGAGLLPYGTDKHKVLSDLKSGHASLTGHQVFKGLSRGNVNTAKAREHLISKGYDGLRYNGGDNMNQATKHDVYIPYHNHSISIKHVEKI